MFAEITAVLSGKRVALNVFLISGIAEIEDGCIIELKTGGKVQAKEQYDEIMRRINRAKKPETTFFVSQSSDMA